MKKSMLFSFAMITMVVTNAQIQFGAKAGVNISNLNYSQSVSGTSSRTSIHAGGLVSIPLFSDFVLQPELLYSGQGNVGKVLNNKYTTQLGYVNIPVLFKYKHASGLFAELGPQLGIMVNAKVKNSGGTTDIKSNFKSTDIAGCFGIGYLSSLNIGIDARYTMGFTDISNTAGNVSIKNNVFQIGLFYMFGGSK